MPTQAVTGCVRSELSGQPFHSYPYCQPPVRLQDLQDGRPPVPSSALSSSSSASGCKSRLASPRATRPNRLGERMRPARSPIRARTPLRAVGLQLAQGSIIRDDNPQGHHPGRALAGGLLVRGARVPLRPPAVNVLAQRERWRRRSELVSRRVKDVMTKDVASVRVTAECKVIIAVMRELHISAFPVLDSADHLVGVVSEADLLLKQVGPDVLAGHLISSGEGEGAKASGVTAGQLMTKPPLTIGPDDSLADAARLMHDRQVKRLPVVDDAGELVGIVSRVDVLSVFDRPDAEIRDAVTEKSSPRASPMTRAPSM